MKQLVLVDGSGYIFRAYYALPRMNRSDGTPVNAVFGFCNMLLKLLEDTQRDNGGDVGFAIIFDAARKTFRNEIYPNYKANRSEPPDDLIPQFEIIKNMPEAFNIASIQYPGFEADDLIASYAKLAHEKGIKTTVVSSDKDLMQLLNNNIKIFDPIKRKELGKKEVFEKFGVEVEKVIDVQALAGDQSDNVPGVPGIGIKTAALLINQYGNLENLLQRCSEIKQEKRRKALEENKDLAIISKKLVTLKDDISLPVKIEEFAFKPMKIEILVDFLDQMEFSRIKSQVLKKYGNSIETVSQKNEDFVSSDSKKNLAPKRIEVKKNNYKLITDVSQLKDWIKLIDYKGYVSIDCETNSLNVMEASIIGFSMSIEDSISCYIPLNHKSEEGKSLNQIQINDFCAIVKPILEDPAILKIGQNLKYDLIILKRLQISCQNYDDTMLMSYVLNSGKHKHGLDELSKIYLNHETSKFSDVTKIKNKKVTFDFVDFESALDYAAEDADVTFRLWEIFKQKLIKEDLYQFYFYIEKPLVNIIINMEIVGMKIDSEILKKLSIKFKLKISEIEKSIYKISGEHFNVGSPKQLGQILFEKMNLPYGKKGKSGNYQTDVNILEKLRNENFLIANKTLEWRQFNKLLTTYCDGLISRENLVTKRIHTSFGMASTITGRLSSNDPNLQNIPIKTSEGKAIREAFVAKPGCKIVSIDYSQIELRILAHVADIKSLKNGFKNNQDIHSITAMDVFQVKQDDVTQELRRRAKTINFGIIYGISPYGLANQLDITNSEAKDYIEKYFSQYPGIKSYMNETIQDCRSKGYVETPFGRKIFIPFINDKVVLRRNFGERSSINAPIQGGAADMIKRAMIKIFDYINTENINTKMILQVHDELLFEVPENELSFIPRKIADIMEKAYEPMIDFSVPIKADIGYGKSWSESH